MYRDNAFHLTDLPTDADGRAVRERRQRFATLADAGDERARSVLPAFERLRDERQRIVHELLWYWDVPEPACGCPSSLHAAHDDAVRRHAQVLRLEQEATADHDELDAMWSEAARLWIELLRRAAVWDHVRHRIDALGDRRMGESTVDELRDALPRALVVPAAELAVRSENPRRMVRNAARWEVAPGVVAAVLDDAVAPLRDGIEVVADRAAADRSAGELARASRDLLAVVPRLERLDALLPHTEHRGTARLLDRVAIQLNNTALDLAGPPPKANAKHLDQLYQAARDLIVAADQRSIIDRNLVAHRERRRRAAAASSQSFLGCLVPVLGVVLGVATGLNWSPVAIAVVVLFGVLILAVVVRSIRLRGGRR